MKVSECGERELLGRIRVRLEASGRPPDVIVGIGDDAAVVMPTRNEQTVLTTDAQIEGIHFERRFSSPADIGYRALAVNLSDLAAMGARPRWALLSLALPSDFAVEEVEDLASGLADLASNEGVRVVGGNLSRSPGPLMVDVTAVGEVRPRRLLTRAGGRAGDELFVSGTIGGAAAGLEILRHAERRPEGGEAAADSAMTDRRHLVERYRRPVARVRLGLAVAQARAARAAMDLSDGLADAIRQVAEASGCGAEIDAAALPIDPEARAWWENRGIDPVAAALGGGDDYELLLAVPGKAAGRLRHVRSRVAEPALTRIGVLTSDRTARVLWNDRRRGVLPTGFVHFAGTRS